jgi:BASS family bile acid:Na+ symporter
VVPSATAAGSVDVLLAALVFVTALDIDPGRVLHARHHWRMILLLAIVPLLVLTAGAWALSGLVHGATRDGVLALGVAPAEVASVGLIGLIGGATELALAVLTVSLVLSAVAGPPLLDVLGHAPHGADVPALMGRFAVVVIAPLIVGLAVRGRMPRLRDRESELAAASTLIVAVLVFASLSGTRAGAVVGALAVSLAFLAFSGVIALLALTLLRARADASLGFSIGMRDFAVAAALAASAFGHRATQVAGVYGAVMLVVAASLTVIVRRSGPPRKPRV